MDYLERLINTLKEKEYSEEYSEKCILYAEQLIKQKLVVIFDTKHLAKLMGIEHSKLFYYIFYNNSLYQTFYIPKKNGSSRKILSPSLNLKIIQRWILENVLNCYPIHKSAVGFRKNKSIVDNAKPHVNKELVYNIDIKNFFPSISFQKIYYLFYNVGYTSEVSFVLTKLLTYKDYLPQGAPTSPHLSNLIAHQMDKDIDQLCSRINTRYTRYADDMTFSTKDSRILINNKNNIKKIVEFHGFELNKSKERLQFKNQPQFVTGLLVNEEVKIRGSFKRKIEQDIYYCERFGIYSHLKKINMADRSFYKEYIYGKVNFVKDVEPSVGEKLLNRLNQLNWSY